jgi:hypothetical protein
LEINKNNFLLYFQVVGDGEVFINVERIVIHPSFNVTPQDNDFALIQLSRSADISNTVNIACLPTGFFEVETLSRIIFPLLNTLFRFFNCLLLPSIGSSHIVSATLPGSYPFTPHLGVNHDSKIPR